MKPSALYLPKLNLLSGWYSPRNSQILDFDKKETKNVLITQLEKEKIKNKSIDRNKSQLASLEAIFKKRKKCTENKEQTEKKEESTAIPLSVASLVRFKSEDFKKKEENSSPIIAVKSLATVEAEETELSEPFTKAPKKGLAANTELLCSHLNKSGIDPMTELRFNKKKEKETFKDLHKLFEVHKERKRMKGNYLNYQGISFKKSMSYQRAKILSSRDDNEENSQVLVKPTKIQLKHQRTSSLAELQMPHAAKDRMLKRKSTIGSIAANSVDFRKSHFNRGHTLELGGSDEGSLHPSRDGSQGNETNRTLDLNKGAKEKTRRGKMGNHLAGFRVEGQEQKTKRLEMSSPS